MDGERQTDKHSRPTAVSLIHKVPETLLNMSRRYYLSLSLCVYLDLPLFFLPSLTDRDSNVWKGGEQNCVFVCEGGEV